MAGLEIHRLTGPKRAIQPGDHQDGWVFNMWGKRSLNTLLTQPVRNNGTTDLWLGARMVLRHVRGWPVTDEDVIIYESGRGIILDVIGRGDTGAFAGPYSLRPGDTFWPFRLAIPGPALSLAAESWWAIHDDSNYNLKLDLYQLPGPSSLISQGRHLGSHEYKSFVNIQYDAPSPARRF